jgi:hypothetical protein
LNSFGIIPVLFSQTKPFNMYKYILLPILVFATLLGFSQSDEKYPALEIGSSMPMADYEMKDVSGETFALGSLMKDNGLLVLFSCNTCPFVIGSGEKNEGWDRRYKEIYEWCDKNDIGFAMVNPNEAKRDLGDSFDDMVARSEEMGWTCKYLLDENSQLANALGGKTTPHAFLFNNESKLVYEGAIDDNHKSEAAVETQDAA